MRCSAQRRPPAASSASRSHTTRPRGSASKRSSCTRAPVVRGRCSSGLGAPAATGRSSGYMATLAPVDPVRWVGAATRASFLLQNGTHDDLTGRPDVVALYRAVRGPKELRWYPASHDLTRQRPPTASGGCSHTWAAASGGLERK